MARLLSFAPPDQDHQLTTGVNRVDIRCRPLRFPATGSARASARDRTSRGLAAPIGLAVRVWSGTEGATSVPPAVRGQRSRTLLPSSIEGLTSLTESRI